MLRTSSIHVFDNFDLYLTPVTLTFNLPKNVSNCTSTPQGQQLRQIVFKSMHYCTSNGPDNSDGRTDARTYTELKLYQLCLAYPQAGSTKMGELCHK